jgi:hypothetical protein
MTDRIDRREAIRRLAVFSAAAAVPAFLVGCKSKPNCNDITGLSPADAEARRTTAQYVEQAPDPAKKCEGCVQFQPGPANACGSCKVVKGPIDPNGYCKLWTKKPA